MRHITYIFVSSVQAKLLLEHNLLGSSFPVVITVTGPVPKYYEEQVKKCRIACIVSQIDTD
jgi:hypothetical protein